jgi:hypothetical protein
MHYLCHPITRRCGKKGGLDVEGGGLVKNYLVDYLTKRISFLPLRPLLKRGAR